MKKGLFVEQPNTELKQGVEVREDSELYFKNEHVEQVLKNLVLETITDNEGCHNGINAFKTKSYIHLGLNEGDILLFDKEMGYYLPSYPVVTVEEAIGDLEALKDMRLEEEEEDDTERSENEGTESH